MIGPEQLAAGERAENAGDYVAAAAAYRAVADLPDEPLAARGHFFLGRVSWRQGRFDAALSAFENARALAERLGDQELQARSDNGIGAVYYARGDYAHARRAYAVAQARTSDPLLRGKILLNLGVIANIEGAYEDALEFYEQSFALSHEGNDNAGAMLALHNRGMVEADLKRWDAADASFLAALAIATELGNREMIAKTLVNRSEVLLERGALEDAASHCDQALEIYSAIGDEVGRGEALRWRALALGRAGDVVAAERSAAESLRIAMRSGVRLLEAEATRDLGVLRGMLGDRAGSLKLLRHALELFSELGANREAKQVGELLQRPTPARAMQRMQQKTED